MADAANASTVYWAAEKDQQELIRRCLERVDWHMEGLRSSGRLDGMMMLLNAYYGLGTDGRRTTRGLRDSDEDATVEWHINQVRPITANTISLVCGQWPKVKPKATNDGARSLAQTRFAERLHKAYEARTASKANIIDTVRGAYLASFWGLGHSWTPQDGKEFAVNAEGQPEYEGDVQTFVLPPWRMVRDFSAADDTQRRWVLFRRPASRWDTAANLEARGQMEKAQALRERRGEALTASWQRRVGTSVATQLAAIDSLLGERLPEEDVVWVWELRHRPSPALPTGRLVRFVEPDVVLWDSLEAGARYPYDEQWLHVFEYSPERVVTGIGGHTSMFDLGALQEFVDLATTSMASTLNVNGQMRFWSQEGLNPRSLGLNGVMLEGGTEPKVLDFPALKPEVIGATNWAIEQGRQTQALNNVVMGQPDKGMPAQAMALLKATALQYHAVSQGEFVRLVKWEANSRLRLLKRFARTKRVELMAGRSAQYEAKEWSQEDIDAVELFDVEEVDPTSDTREARQAYGEMLVARGLITPDAFLALVQTGNLEQGLQTKTAQKELVEANVELLQSGVGLPPIDMAATQQALLGDPNALPVFAETSEPVVRILKSDPHHLAVPAYLAVVTSPASRSDPKRMQAALDAVRFSLQCWASLSPDEAAAYGVPPLPSQSAMMGPPPGPGAPPPSGDAGPAMPQGAPDDVKRPVDPSTGERLPGPPGP